MNKRKLLILMLLGLLLNVQWAAAAGKGSVRNVRFEQRGDKYIIRYDLKSDAVVNLSVKGRLNGSSVTRDVYVTGKKENEKVTGDVGYVMAGTGKVIEWTYRADEELREISNVSDFDVESKKIFEPVKTSMLGTFGYSFKPEQMSYGLMVGVTSNKNGWGGFAHFRSNFNFGVSTKYSCDENGNINGYSCFYNGETKTLYYMANAGVMYNFLQDKRSKSMVSLGLGLGYGSREVYWQMESGEWVNNAGLKNSGVSAELNLLASIKMFSLMAGVNTVNFKYFELEVGIGVTF